MEEREIMVSSELIWSFDNTRKDLLRAYPNGQCLNDILQTSNGQLWNISLYPNGAYPYLSNSIQIFVTLIGSKEANLQSVRAECRCLIENRETKLKLASRFKTDLFLMNKTEEDGRFSSKFLEECNDGCTIAISIRQYDEEFACVPHSSSDNNSNTNDSTIEDAAQSDFEETEHLIIIRI